MPGPTPDCFDSSPLYDVNFVSSTEGWAVGYGRILHTVDGGRNWEVQRRDDSFWEGDRFREPVNGWTVGYGWPILATTNGGATWSSQTAGTNYLLYDVDFVDDSYVGLTQDAF